eukprot:gnl/TRDRNA2_/TRDRNA2_83426_c0_seq1.p1 gnl/TRDRNA2_/TRDRNA2_83426_c0~~gnl/TRDRNA2_/TRDRNA2_83426_c0_seq1.p1  ORF type:complete len:631 (-),score=157.06 gnl/TRDRNA2_/TRDRNA2_83426_c0_seq1:53-1945(-)
MVMDAAQGDGPAAGGRKKAAAAGESDASKGGGDGRKGAIDWRGPAPGMAERALRAIRPGPGGDHTNTESQQGDDTQREGVGKGAKKGAKGERGGKGAARTKESSWVKKGEAEPAEADHHEKLQHEKSTRRDNQKEKKDTWKERRGKQDKSKVSDESKETRGENAPALNGGTLLSMLKANMPSVRRYTRQELLSIGQLPASRVKPPTLDEIIDKDNAESPLLLKARMEKALRGKGLGEDWDGYEQEGAKERRGRPNNRSRHERDDSDDEDVRRPEQETLDDAWDMPNPNLKGSLDDFCLGDIRQAEKSINQGMSMADYKASLQKSGAGRKPGGPQPSAQRPEDPFSAEKSVFIDENEDDMRGPRGHRKWFGKGPGDNAAAPDSFGAATAKASAPEPAKPSAPLAGTGDATEKLSVAELFNLAQGKEMPPLPQKGGADSGLADQTAEWKMQMQQDVLKMASQFMWASAAKAGQPSVPPHPGSFGHAGGRPSSAQAAQAVHAAQVQAQMQLYQEAYMQAMMGMGRGGFPVNGGGQAPWMGGLPMGSGYPFGPRGPAAYGQQPMGAYPPHDFSHSQANHIGTAGQNPGLSGARSAMRTNGGKQPDRAPQGEKISPATDLLAGDDGDEDAGCSQS